MVIDPAASGPDTHLDPDRMADLYDGLLEPAAAEAAQSHLASCRQCADDFALITMDSGLDGFLAPEPIPAEVAIRIEAALHQEPPLVAPTAVPQHSAAPRKSRRFRVMFGSLAGATLVVAGVVAGISALGSGGGSASSSAKGGSASQFSQNNDSESHAAGGQSPAVGAAPNSAPNSTGAGPNSAAAAPNAADLSVERQAEQLLGRIGQSQVAGTSGESKTDGPRFACPPAGFENTAPLGMTSITYQGRAAELLVYPKPGDPAHAAVFVVATDGCTGSAPGVVLDTLEVARR